MRAWTGLVREGMEVFDFIKSGEVERVKEVPG